MSNNYPFTIEHNTFRENDDKWKNVIHVYSDSHIYNCEVYGAIFLAHAHKRNEVCDCDNWQGLYTQ